MSWKAVKWVHPGDGGHHTTGDLVCGDKMVEPKMVEPNDEKVHDTVVTLTGDHGDECLILNFYRPELLRMDSCGLL